MRLVICHVLGVTGRTSIEVSPIIEIPIVPLGETDAQLTDDAIQRGLDGLHS